MRFAANLSMKSLQKSAAYLQILLQGDLYSTHKFSTLIFGAVLLVVLSTDGRAALLLPAIGGACQARPIAKVTHVAVVSAVVKMSVPRLRGRKPSNTAGIAAS